MLEEPGPRWVELTKTNGEIDAQLVAGGLEAEGIRTHLEKAPGVWRYGASDPFALVTIYVPDDQLVNARALISDPSADHFEFDQPEPPPEAPELPDPFLRSRPLRWWIAALGGGARIRSPSIQPLGHLQLTKGSTGSRAARSAHTPAAPVASWPPPVAPGAARRHHTSRTHDAWPPPTQRHRSAP